MRDPLLSIEDVFVAFETEAGLREVLREVTFSLEPGEIVGVVGESGSGKSVTALAVMRLLGAQGRITQGRIALEGVDLVALDREAMRKVRGGRIGMIFQEPMTSLNPLFTVGFQVAEVLQAHLGLEGAAARREVISWFERVGIPNASLRFDEYPHSLSGGMRQRVMIAMAMACRPALLIADEPTTALDVTIQAQILSLMKELRREHGTAILLITHDMGVIARMAERVVVMYAGEVVEVGTLRQVFTAPAHPYTRLLLAAMPTTRRRSDRLPVISGVMPTPGAMPPACRFEPRCPQAMPRCRERAPPSFAVGRRPFGALLARCASAADAGRRAGAGGLMTHPILRVENLSRSFKASDGRLVKAVEDVSFEIAAGETLGIVGEVGLRQEHDRAGRAEAHPAERRPHRARRTGHHAICRSARCARCGARSRRCFRIPCRRSTRACGCARSLPSRSGPLA